MDIFSLLSYINRISLLAFFVTFLVVGYQIYVLRKDKTKEQTPSIPDFKDKTKSNEVVNYTRLPNFLIKKDNKPTNYSKLVFLIISLLTIMVIIFVFILIKQNSSVRKVLSPSQKSPTIRPIVTLLPKLTLTPSPTNVPILPSPTVSSSLSPTEIVLAKTQTCKGQSCLTPTKELPTIQEITNGKPQTLPETGNIGKGFLIFGVAISTIFFSFWF